jgi:Fuc2NAc and GlcNAc transferase
VRFRDREKLTRPHRRHLYQLLANEFRIPHWKVTMLYGSVQLMIGFSVIFVRHYGLAMVLLLLTVCFIVFALISLCVRRKLLPV